MNRQGSHSFTIDALMSPSVNSRMGPSVYNSGYMFMPPAGNINMLRGIGAYTGADSVLSSAMMQYAQTPFPPFPLMAAASGLYPGQLHGAFTSSNFPGLPVRQSTTPFHAFDQIDKTTKKPNFDTITNCNNEDSDTSHPTDLRITVPKAKATDEGELLESQISKEDLDDHPSDVSLEGIELKFSIRLHVTC